MDINIKFINKSNDANNSHVVIFQKNVAKNSDLHHLAWHTINLDQNEFHTLTVHPQTMISVTRSKDIEKNIRETSDMINIDEGELFVIATEDDGNNVLKSAGSASSSDEIQLRNDLAEEEIIADIYKGITDSSGSFHEGIVATKWTVPGDTATFDLEPKIYIGVCEQLQSGEIINESNLSCVAEISLDGVSSADIIVAGGESQPTSLEVTNIVHSS